MYLIIKPATKLLMLLVLISCSNGTNSVNSEPITIALTSNLADVVLNQTVIILWTVKNADSCMRSGLWNGRSSLMGSEEITINTRGVNTFTLLCSSSNQNLSKTITINGIGRPFYNEFSETKSVDIVAVYGQSNAVGYGFTEPPLSNESYTGNKMSQKCLDSGDILLINEDCFSSDYISDPSDIYKKGLHSAWIDFDSTLSEKSSRTIHLVNAAVGATVISALLKDAEKEPSLANGINEYNNLINGIKNSFEIYGIENINSLSIIWLQGESDVIRMVDNILDYDQEASLYFDSLNELRSSILEDLDIPKLEFFIIRLGNTDGPYSNYSSIQNDLGFWQIKYSLKTEGFTPISVLPRTYQQNNLLLSSDGIHYTKLGYEMLGKDLAINFFKYLNKDESFLLELDQENDTYPPNIILDSPF